MSATSSCSITASGSHRFYICICSQKFGDNSRILDSIFLNFLSIPFIDPTLERCSVIHEWLSASDIYRNGNTPDSFSMEALHIPVVAGVLHLLCRVETKQDLVYSTRMFTDMQYQRETSEALALRFAAGTPSHRVSFDTTVRCTIPYLLWVLSAGTGTGALQRVVTSAELLSPNEKASFDAHVQLMVQMGLNYVMRSESGAMSAVPTMILEPPIQKLVQFSLLHLVETDLPKDIPFPVRQMLFSCCLCALSDLSLFCQIDQRASLAGYLPREDPEAPAGLG